MRAIDVDDLSEEFWENIKLTGNAQVQLKTDLNETLPLAKHLQTDVFYPHLPVVSFILFILSSVVLLVCLASSSPKRRYKLALVLGVLLGAFALATTFATAMGSLQVLNALMIGGRSKEVTQLDNDIFLSRGERLDLFQASQASLVGLFYSLVGIMFVGRQPEAGSAFQIFQVGTAFNFLSGRP